MSVSKEFLAGAIVIALTGCASSGILKSGGDRYIVSKTSMQVGFGAPTGVHADISKEADDFCAKQGKSLDVVDTRIEHPAIGKPGSATLEFRCKEKGA
jgi:hypothetical protein